MCARPLPIPPAEEDLPLSYNDMMERALAQAHLAEALAEAPVGAALFAADGTLLAEAHNSPITQSDPTAHAEILCLRRACRQAKNYRLPGAILAVTLEPCLMCVGAIIHARLAGVVYGADDPKSGALATHMDGNQLSFTNHKFWVRSGIMADRCSLVLTEFFRRLR